MILHRSILPPKSAYFTRVSPLAGLVYYVVVVFLIVSAYLEIPFAVADGLYVPSFFVLCILPFMLVHLKRDFSISDFYFLTALACLLLLSVLASPGKEYLSRKVLGLVQTMASVVMGLVLVKFFEKVSKKAVSRILLSIILVIIVGAALEILGPLRIISDGFRDYVYFGSPYGVYSAEDRDIALAGFERPKFFASEPSLVATGLFVFINSWLVLNPSPRRIMAALFFNATSLYLTASPNMIYSALASLCIYWVYRGGISKVASSIFYLLPVFAVIIWALPEEAPERLMARFSDAFFNVDTYAYTSENIRLVFPFITMFDILQQSPFFGIGISGHDLVETYSSLPFDGLSAFGNNNIAAVFSYLGLVGGPLFFIILYKYVKSCIGYQSLLAFLMCYVGLCLMMGGLQTPRFWSYVFLFLAAIRRNPVVFTRTTGATRHF